MFTGKGGDGGDDDACSLRNPVAGLLAHFCLHLPSCEARRSLQHKSYNAYRNTHYGMPHSSYCRPLPTMPYVVQMLSCCRLEDAQVEGAVDETVYYICSDWCRGIDIVFNTRRC